MDLLPLSAFRNVWPAPRTFSTAFALLIEPEASSMSEKSISHFSWTLGLGDGSKAFA